MSQQGFSECEVAFAAIVATQFGFAHNLQKIADAYASYKPISMSKSVGDAVACIETSATSDLEKLAYSAGLSIIAIAIVTLVTIVAVAIALIYLSGTLRLVLVVMLIVGYVAALVVCYTLRPGDYTSGEECIRSLALDYSIFRAQTSTFIDEIKRSVVIQA